MTAPITADGFAGIVIDEIDWSRIWTLSGPAFRVGSVNDWAPSPDSGVNRQVNVTAGRGYACGLMGTTTAPASITFAANTGTQNRYDALVVSYAWAANAGAGLAARTITLRVITGTSTPPQVNPSLTAVDNTKINRIPGVQYDALIAVVRVRPGVGILSSGDVVDCRTWGGHGGYVNCGSAQYLTLLDTFPGALVHDISTSIVWSRNLGGVWGFEKWIGSDKSKQPMLALRNISAASTAAGTSLLPVYWIDVVDHSGGLLSLVSDGVNNRYVRANVPGRVVVKAHAYSDAGSEGVSFIQLSLPTGGGDYFSVLTDERTRNTGYLGAGTLRQTVSTVLQVQPGDVFDLMVLQNNTASAPLGYQFYMSVTYV